MDELAVGADHVGRDEVVAGEPARPHQPADAAAEREARDAGGGDEPASGCESERLRLVVELGPGEAALGLRGSRGGVHPDALHAGEVDHDPSVAGGEAGEAVLASANRHEQVLAACEFHRLADVRHSRAANDRRRVLVDRAVPHGTRLVVARVGGPD